MRAHKGRQPIWLFSRGCKDNTGFWGLEEARPYILKDGSAEIYEFPTHLLEAYAKGVRNAVCLPPVLDYAALAAYGYALKSDLTVSKVVLKFIDDEYGRSRAVKIERAFENMGILVEKNFEKINS